MFKVIDMVSKHIGAKGIWVFDCGGDREKVFDKLLVKGAEKRFAIRLKKTRDLVHKGVAKNCHALASHLPCDYKATLIKYEDGQEQVKTVWYSVFLVKFPRQRPEIISGGL